MFDEIIYGTADETTQCRAAYKVKGEKIVQAVRLGGTLYVTDIIIFVEDDPTQKFVSFSRIGWWKDGDEFPRRWPSDHPDDLNELASLMALARMEGKL